MNIKPIPKQKKRFEKISNYLKELRINENLTQLEVSQETALHHNTLIRVENAKNFTLNTLFLLADFYQLSPAEILEVLD